MEFVQTCMACPEQYDVYLDNEYVAYVRLRWGKLRVDNAKGNCIFSHDFQEPFKGTFDSEEERKIFLDKIEKIIKSNYVLHTAMEQNSSEV